MPSDSQPVAPSISECFFEGNRWSGDGVKLAYALRNGEVVHVSTVPNGAACGCICPGCRLALIARQGEEKQDHFAHPAGTTCRTGPQTALHYLGKQLLEKRPVLLLPALVASVGEQTVVIAEAAEVTLTNVRIEERLDGVIPDVMATVDGRDLLIEIYYTHKCGREKKKRLADMDLDTVEIDLSRLVRNAKIPKVAAALRSLAPREWVYNARIAAVESKLKEQGERRRQAQERAEEGRRRAQASRVAKLVAAATEAKAAADRRSPPPPKLAGILEHVRHSCFGNLVGAAAQGDFAFTVAPATWQALLINRFVLGPLNERHSSEFTLREAFEYPRLYHLIVPGLSGFISDSDEAAVRREIPDFVSPFNVLMTYLDYLEIKGILSRSMRGRRKLSSSVLRDEESRRVNAGVIQSRRGEITHLVETILDRLGSEGSYGFDVEKWFATQIAAIGCSPLKACETGFGYSDLDWRLRRLRSMLEPGAEPEPELLGLPLSQVLALRVEEEQQRAEQKWRHEQQMETLAVALYERALRATIAELGLPDGWIDTPSDQLGGQTPIECARRDYNGFSAARTEASRAAAQLARRRA